MTYYTHTLAIASLAFALSIPGYAVAEDGGHNDHGNHGGNQSDDRGNHDNTVVPNVPATGNLADDKSGHDGSNNNPGDNNQNNNNQNNNNGVNVPLNRLNVRLMATASGETIHAGGNVDIRAHGQRQQLRVEVEADAIDGTIFSVSANGVPVGSVTIRFNEGELEIDNEDGRALPGGLLPSDVTTVKVTDLSGTAILQAQFAALKTVSSPPNSLAEDRRIRASLTPTTAGLAIGASGHVDLRQQGQRARLKVEVEANVADGAVFTILANGIAAGSVTLRLGDGEFELESEHTMLPQGLSLIGSITSIQVVGSDGTAILTAAL